MHRLPLNIFRKSALCPTSQTLLDYQRLDVTLREMQLVEAHLTDCEFCGAELQLLNRYQYRTETPVLGEIPIALRRLAEMVLSRRQMAFGAGLEIAETQILN